LETVNVYVGGRRIAQPRFREPDSHYPYVVILAQSDTERIPIRHLEGFHVRVERETELIDCSQDRRGVTARLRHARGGRNRFARPGSSDATGYDPPPRNRGLQQHRLGDSPRTEIGGVLRAARHLQPSVHTVDRLADDGAHADFSAMQ